MNVACLIYKDKIFRENSTDFFKKFILPIIQHNLILFVKVSQIFVFVIDFLSCLRTITDL
jgi:hypothetical protein